MNRILTYFIMINMIQSMGNLGFSQEFNSNSKEVIISTYDSIMRFDVMTSNKEIEVDNSLTYYWYIANQVNMNRGGYSGKLLQGNFQVMNPDKKLITLGSFLEGVKHGNWKKWDKDGNLLSLTKWEKGKLNGTSYIYGHNGKLKYSCQYKNGLRNGYTYEYKNDSISNKVKYKNGVIAKQKWKEVTSNFYKKINSQSESNEKGEKLNKNRQNKKNENNTRKNRKDKKAKTEKNES